MNGIGVCGYGMLGVVKEEMACSSTCANLEREMRLLNVFINQLWWIRMDGYPCFGWIDNRARDQSPVESDSGLIRYDAHVIELATCR